MERIKEKCIKKIHCFFKNKKKAFFYFLIFFVAFFSLEKFYKRKANKIESYHNLEEKFSKWKTNPDSKLDAEFETLFKKYPKIFLSHRGEIVQKFLKENNEKGIKKGYELLKDQDESDYKNFSLISLLISQKKYEEALSKSLSLKEKIEKTSSLYFFNLLQISCLEKALQKKEELTTLKEIENYISNAKNLSLLKKFQKEKEFCLKDYILHRKKELSL